MKSRGIAWVAVIGVFAVAGTLFTLGSSQASPDGASPTPPARGDAAQMNARRALGSYVNAVENALSGLPSFGGTWFKQVGDGVIVVGLTSPPTAAVTQMVDSVVPANSAVEFVQVAVSYSQLEALYKSITATPLSADGITSVWIQTADNTVAVGAATQAVADAVYAKYGHTGLTVTVAAPAAAPTAAAPAATAAPSRNFTSGPLYGGEWVAFNNGIKCTIGHGYLTNAAGQLSALTAGHCAPSGTGAHQGNSTGDPAIGSGMHDSQVVAGGTTDCDCGFVGPISSSQISHQTLVKNNSLYTFTATGIPYSGENECQSGAASYESNGGNIVCGQVIAINGATPVGYQDGSFTLQNAIVWLGTSIQGDSGAPVGDGPNLMGFVAAASSTVAGISYFSKASIVYQVTGLTLNYLHDAAVTVGTPGPLRHRRSPRPYR
jgi:hypothetical protein